MKMWVREREYSCSWRAMTRGSSFLMSWGYHWATFSPKSFMRRSLCGVFMPVGFNWWPKILARASTTPWFIATLNMFFKLPLAIFVFFCDGGSDSRHKEEPLLCSKSLFGFFTKTRRWVLNADASQGEFGNFRKWKKKKK